MGDQPFPPAARKKILRVLFISLLLDLVSLSVLNSAIYTLQAANTLTLTHPDILHLHPPPLPPTHLFLPQPRSLLHHPWRPLINNLSHPPRPHPPRPKCLQILLRTPNLIKIRYCPARRCFGLSVLPLSSHRLPHNRPPLRHLWPAPGPSLFHGRKYPLCRALGRRNRLPHISCLADRRRAE